MFALKSPKQNLLYLIVVCILFLVNGCDKTGSIQSLVTDTDDIGVVEKLTAEEMFEKEILIPIGMPQIVTIKEVKVKRIGEEVVVDRISFEKNTPLFLTREVAFSGDPVFEVLEEDTYGDSEDELISEIMKYGLYFTFSEAEHFIKETSMFSVLGVDGYFQGYALPLKDANDRIIFKSGDQIEVVQESIWRRKSGALQYPSVFKVLRNLTRPEIDYSIYDWDADIVRPE